MTEFKGCACGCGQPASPTATYARGHNRRTASHKVWYFIQPKGRWVVLDRAGSEYLWYRIVMWNELGRELRADEVVHHVNGDSADDRVENLCVLSRGEHMALHRAQGDHADAVRKFEEARERRAAAHRTVIACETCGASMQRPRHRVRDTHNFCSPTCFTASLRERVALTCSHCGTPIERTASKMKRSRLGVFFCSLACKGAYSRKVAA